LVHVLAGFLLFGLLSIMIARHCLDSKPMKQQKPSIQLDKYARDPRAWRDAARFNYSAALELFTCDNKIVTCISGATLAHLSLEMFLKAALIVQGMTVFDPKLVHKLDPTVKLAKEDCVWGHQLVAHARLLAKRRPDFDLNDTSKVPFHFPHQGPMTLERAFAIFDPFFFELRYPQKLVDFDSVGPDDLMMFESLVEALHPFLKSITGAS
jgi:hypothetical protein